MIVEYFPSDSETSAAFLENFASLDDVVITGNIFSLINVFSGLVDAVRRWLCKLRVSLSIFLYYFPYLLSISALIFIHSSCLRAQVNHSTLLHSILLILYLYYSSPYTFSVSSPRFLLRFPVVPPASHLLVLFRSGLILIQAHAAPLIAIN